MIVLSDLFEPPRTRGFRRTGATPFVPAAHVGWTAMTRVPTAPPGVVAPAPSPSVAPAPRASASVARVRAMREQALVNHLDRFKLYPDVAQARGNQGDVTVQFTLDRTGQVNAARVVQSSG